MDTFQSKYSGEQIEQLLDKINDITPGQGTDTPTPSTPKGYELYCYRKSTDNNSPYTRIEYLEDNATFRPAGMDFINDKFDYGDWGNAFFMKVKPVMLNYDGTVAYELDPNDYTKKIDGKTSDITDVNYGGNVMIGIPTIWFKRETVGRYTYVYVCNKKLDESFKAYAHINANGDLMKYTYYPAYNGNINANRLRSISGLAPTTGTTTTQEFAAALANNPTGKRIWHVEPRADVQMLYDLCLLIGKSNNTQKTFGYGNYTGGSNASSFKVAGTLNKKGLFWGSRNTNDCVKVFGIENFWGQRWGRIAGSIYANNQMKVKMTYGTEDGSTTVGYNETGEGYITIENSTITGTSGGYISESYTNEYGTFPKTVSGSDDTYECDGCWFTENQVNVELHGGGSDNGLLVGAGCVYVNSVASYSGWNVGASCSCKPDAEENILQVTT